MTRSDSRYDQAKQWLLAYLADGKLHLLGEVFIRGSEAGHSEQMLRSAARRNGVKLIHACIGYGRQADVGVQCWQLPAKVGAHAL